MYFLLERTGAVYRFLRMKSLTGDPLPISPAVWALPWWPPLCWACKSAGPGPLRWPEEPYTSPPPAGCRSYEWRRHYPWWAQSPAWSPPALPVWRVWPADGVSDTPVQTMEIQTLKNKKKNQYEVFWTVHWNQRGIHWHLNFLNNIF